MNTFHSEFFRRQQNELRQSLSNQNIDSSLIDSVIKSGYFNWGIGNYGSDCVKPAVADSYYGNKYSGLIPFDRFVEYLRTGAMETLPSLVREYGVKSMKDAVSILASPEHAPFAQRMSFRGQTEEYKIRRSIPNPNAADTNNSERMIVPSWWRKWINKNPIQRESRSSFSLFSNSLFSAPFLFSDIPNWREHASHWRRENENENASECDICEEMSHRAEAHDANASFSGEVPALEQHYGMSTICLDITFELSTALFFASHKFVSSNGKASYLRTDNGGHKGVVYCFVFESPAVAETNALIRTIDLFKQLEPLRPIRQRCGLPAFQFNEIAAAARDLHLVMYLHDSFDLSGVPKMADLFPNRDEDTFYGALLEARARQPELWQEIIEYE